MPDIFQPKSEPARSIYEAFQLEAAKRNERGMDEWQSAELNAVHVRPPFRPNAWACAPHHWKRLPMLSAMPTGLSITPPNGLIDLLMPCVKPLRPGLTVVQQVRQLSEMSS